MSLKDLLGKAKDRLAGDRPSSRPGRPSRDTESNGHGIPVPADVTAPPPAPGPRPCRLLVVAGRDTDAREFLRASQNRGHECESCGSVSEVRPLLARRTFDAVVLHPDLSPDTVLLLGASIRVSQPGCRIVVVREEDDPDFRARLGRIGVEDVLTGPTRAGGVVEHAARPRAAELDLTRFGEVSDKEISVLEALLEVQPECRENLWLLGFAYYRSRRFDEALRMLRRITSRVPSDTQALYYVGSCLFRLDRKQGARDAWRKVTVLEPGTSIARRAQKHLDSLRGTLPPV